MDPPQNQMCLILLTTIGCDAIALWFPGFGIRSIQIYDQLCYIWNLPLKYGRISINVFRQDFQPMRECKCASAKFWSDFEQQECVVQFLMGVKESYSELRSQVISQDPLPPLSNVLSLLLQEERQRSIMEKGQSSSSRVKMMEKKCYKFVVRNYSAYEGIGMGNWIQSRAFVVGGHKFRLHLYPQGKDLASHYGGLASLLIKNESATSVQLVAALEVLDRQGSGVHAGYSFFDDRIVYKHVVTIEAGKRYGEIDFHIESGGYVRQDSIIIRATLGVFVDHPSKPLERCVVFQVGDRRYYADEAVITMRCPALLSVSQSQSQSDHIVISDVKTNVFEAVLWFIYNQVIHKRDIEAIASSNLFALKILAAADRFQLNGLRRQCESYVCYGQVVELYYLYEPVFKELWSYGCKLWAKMKEVMSQEMNEA
ncbi:BTB/POZ and MATH domain-containing protein 5-like isoform X2 [Salvia miltiorrhiza]|uniref:BTB/POZ and MATH domain-containing protein 5-like isoform X2 n=1 Tax=Salvia miltiorrhiza TaxID=226208 RepID=UPI0025AC6DEB|nr:BTB/POZ and MATH domain-containing protein 5-like isoform X2 [Salvia miltiorrhiza]